MTAITLDKVQKLTRAKEDHGILFVYYYYYLSHLEFKLF